MALAGQATAFGVLCEGVVAFGPVYVRGFGVSKAKPVAAADIYCGEEVWDGAKFHTAADGEVQ